MPLTLLITGKPSSLSSRVQKPNGSIGRTGTLAATYVFAAPSSAKYLSESIDAYVSWINHVPENMLSKQNRVTCFLYMLNIVLTMTLQSVQRTPQTHHQPQRRGIRLIFSKFLARNWYHKRLLQP